MTAATELERRLADALDARAGLVQPEHLRSDPWDAEALRAGSAPGHPRRRRLATYAVAAAACGAAIVGPLAMDRPDPRPQPAPAPVPGGWVGGEGRRGPGAGLEGSRTTADLDGDGATDSVWVRSGGGRTAPVRVEALLSSAPGAVRWTLLDHEAVTGGVDGSVELDGDEGEELLVSTEDEGGFTWSVVQLVDGRLQQVAGPADGTFRSGPLPDGRTRSVRVAGDRLVSWTSRRELREDQQRARVDATWWRTRDVDGIPTLAAARTGEQCIDLMAGLFGDCLPNGEPDAEPPEVGGGNPGDVVPDFRPEAGENGFGQDVPLTVGGREAVARLAGTADRPTLEVEVDGTRLVASLGSGPARLLDGPVTGERYDAVLVLRGSATDAAGEAQVWTVRDGDLVELTVSDEAPFGVGVQGSGTGERRYRTRLGVSGLLWTELTTADPEVRRVWTWTLDEGPGVVAREAGCFRFPGDGSEVTFAESC